MTARLEALAVEAAQAEEREKSLREAILSGQQANTLLASTEALTRSLLHTEIAKNSQYEERRESLITVDTLMSTKMQSVCSLGGSVLIIIVLLHFQTSLDQQGVLLLLGGGGGGVKVAVSE